MSSNDFIISMIKEKLGTETDINNYRTAYPSISIAKGAVIFGFNPFIIRSRISRFTIGIVCDEIWNEKSMEKGKI